MTKMFIQHFRMKKGQKKYTQIAKEINLNGNKKRSGCIFYISTVNRLYKNI
jgi:hypothetical protein